MVVSLAEVEGKHANLEARHKAEIKNHGMMIEKLHHQFFGLRKGKFCRSSEGLGQLDLKLEDEEMGQEQALARFDQ